ncbi:MAG TPA: hypothetical protein H9742_06880 [Candidatus Acetatifactor stercoripullorum]|uniref:Uncharacterized protein n=1 Tax=Candidatus Acetatifactor stercoripullorum TaxID=2838414 RepID=A0A9D1R578_9FIRM|nr:hypothetical protein [uncultured Acetatifactor sp.]HIW81242.1 hypothetical protein [Candidatus Acetatifactor stercoripullorum]
MLEVKFYDTAEDSLLKFAVIISKSNGKWVFCKHYLPENWTYPLIQPKLIEKYVQWERGM